MEACVASHGRGAADAERRILRDRVQVEGKSIGVGAGMGAWVGLDVAGVSSHEINHQHLVLS